MQWVIDIKQSLVALDPRLWPLTIAVVVGALYWIFKRLWPEAFRRLPAKLKAVPGAVAAAALSGAAAPDITEFLVETIIGTLTAGGGHEFIARLRHGSKQDRAFLKQEAADLKRIAKKQQEKLE